MLSKIRKLAKNEDGATAIEYALIAALISIAAVVAFQSVGTQISTTMTTVKEKMANAPAGG
ncbi:Flp family type IVb pilin [Vineibacter terrae]|uniref:Flp family type IVb pilin n=1 Tax=Vineibacter terrae TaxID=2586908 RepID=UPI002E3242FE|nr:Flp family type IVb pilin [Vineibacter terrae]HEX2885555.1 Flp family type IVb pilin [Vineibacter terrae]